MIDYVQTGSNEHPATQGRIEMGIFGTYQGEIDLLCSAGGMLQSDELLRALVPVRDFIEEDESGMRIRIARSRSATAFALVSIDESANEDAQDIFCVAAYRGDTWTGFCELATLATLVPLTRDALATL